MEHPIVEILAVILVPVFILWLFGVVEQRLERINYNARLIKIAWESQVFAIGAQFGFISKELLLGNRDKILFATLCVGAIGVFALALWKMRLKLGGHNPYDTPTNDQVFYASWAALTSLCIPGVYVLMLSISGRTP